MFYITYAVLPAFGQSSIKVYSYEELKPLLNRASDTTFIINFWATWCVPCIKELPDFEKLNAKYKDEKFKMILVSLDFKKSLESRLIPYVEKNELKAEVILLYEPDANAWIPQVDDSWTGAIPATVIYNSAQSFRKFREGSYTYNELNEIVKHLLIP
jgi:thiol-disulfide isomerase/thioredoxin